MGEPKFEDDVAAFDIAEVAEPLSERIEDRRSVAVCRRQHADARERRAQLERSANRPRPGGPLEIVDRAVLSLKNAPFLPHHS